ncbi:MAG: gamma-glutamyl-phosphate reductase, partial [Methylobacter sp.]
MDIKEYMTSLGRQAKKAGREISRTESGKKDTALLKIAEAIDSNQEMLIAENQKDLDAGRKNGLDAALLDRLALNPKAIQAMVEGLKQVAALPDPVGE